MLQKLQQHINTNFSFLQNKKLLIAISGGIDSVVLTHVLSQLQFDISLAHCNFNLRKNESDADEQLVIALGKELNIKTIVTHFNTEKFAKENKQSIQLAARNLRYTWFEELLSQYSFDYLLTAHHADDNLETFLINLSRGTGLDGLTGIPTVNGNIIRPLLSFSRDEIVQFATKNDLNWREDQSNTDTKYLRNKIRWEILPVLKEINPSILDSFQKTLEHLQESQQLIDDRIKEVEKDAVEKFEDYWKMDIEKIKSYSNSKAYLYQILKECAFTEWDDVVHLLEAQSGKQVYSTTHRLLKDRNFLLLSKITSSVSSSVVKKFLIDNNTSEIKHPIHLNFETVSETTSQEKKTIYLDKKKLTFPLILRKWQKGDFFYPTGMQGKKKLSNYFKDEKYSLLEKENTWILCAEKDILWIVGKRQDRRFLSNSSATNLLKISLLSNFF